MQMMLHVIFISCPAILGSAYLTKLLRDLLFEWKGIEVSDLVFQIFLFFVMGAAMLLSSQKVLRTIFRQQENAKCGDRET